MTNTKCVIVVDEALPVGVMANATAVLGVTVGKQRGAEMVGADLPDYDGHMHQGITTIPIPILKGNAAVLKQMRQQAKKFEPELLVVGVIGATRTTRSYEEYATVLKDTPVADVDYLGLAFFGDKKTVAKFTGSLGLLR